MAIHADVESPIENGDTAVSVIYHIMDAEGSLWKSAPALVLNAVRLDGAPTGTLNASGMWLRIPTMRHLLEGTTAEIEIYIQRDGADLQLFRTIGNDPTVDYIDFCVQAPLDWDGSSALTMRTLEAVLAEAGPGELDYTTGDALANDPPPQCSAITVWRNRAFACRGNSVYPSQEFRAGFGIQWSYVTRFEWNDGTGDIVGMCPIDWNYLALFKQDAIGIVSGAGPDGNGRGNYIVQTLQTRMGCYDPASLVNGADGCYFQDFATKRVAALTPQLNPQECLLGWFNEENATVTSAMQVESRRQVWFSTDDKQIIVLDYKHKTQASPFGQVFTWDLASLGVSVVSMAIVSGLPTVLFSDGTTGIYYEAQPCDQNKTGTLFPILMKARTGALQPGNLQGMFDVSRLQFLGEYLSKHGLKLTTYPSYATSGTSVQTTISAAPEQVVTRPPNCQRIQSLEVEFEETYIDTYGKGFEFVGFALEIQSRGKLQLLSTGRII